MSKNPIVSVIMGSTSDYNVMSHSEQMLEKIGVSYETLVVSAHRTPERLYKYAKEAESRSLQVIIAGAGGAAHLPGMVASMTTLPVLGVPIAATELLGIDSFLSIAQMPKGTPVATFAIGKAGAQNAAIFACKILGLQSNLISTTLKRWMQNQADSVPLHPNSKIQLK